MGHSGCRGRGLHRRVPATTSIPPSPSSATSFTKPIPQWDEIAACGRHGCWVNQPSGPLHDNCCRFFSFSFFGAFLKLRQIEKPGGNKSYWEIIERAQQIQIVKGFYYDRYIYSYDLFGSVKEAIDQFREKVINRNKHGTRQAETRGKILN